MTASELPGEQPPQDDTALLTAALSHSWAWYEERTNRTVQVINYYIVATAIVVTAYTSAIDGKHYGFAAALAIAGLALTAIASVAALKGVNAAALAEPALIEMQERVGARLKIESMRIARLQIGIRQRRAAVAVTFGLGSLIDIGALLYA
jgi:plasmid replication initiation protein